MSPESIGYAAALILGKRQPVTVYLAQGLNHTSPQATDRIPTGRSKAVMVGRYDRHITLDELAQDLNAAQAELTKKGKAA